jgi:hypothetical protein
MLGHGGVAQLADPLMCATTPLPLWRISTVRSVIRPQSLCRARAWGTE